ncbi:MAG TPA: ankyrin repeat domain-containing protein [Gemmatimonadaceae bacterium]|nr:ankyrin repeat domain-containing protein [Gemmatimonadaceae bacterium]
MATLPEAPSLEWLRKQAKQRLASLRHTEPAAKLADAQLAVARDYGFPSWRALKAHVDSLTLSGRLFTAARAGEAARVATMLDEHPELMDSREPPHGWTLLHAAAQMGHLGIVDLLLRRGFDVNAKEKGDDTTALHWAAAAGRVDVVKRLLEAGVDPVGAGDDHGLTAIGWATCWHGTDTGAHREIVRLLLAAGGRHTIFSAIGANDARAVREIAAADPAAIEQRMSRNENHRRPLHHAVSMNRAEMVTLLLALGADPEAPDDAGMTPLVYAAADLVQPRTIGALVGDRRDDLFASLALGDLAAAERVVRAHPSALNDGALAFHARRRDARAVRWLLDHGADPNARWSHWGANLTALHLAAMNGDEVVVRMLLDAGADTSIRDAVHDGDPAGWALHHGHTALAELLR